MADFRKIPVYLYVGMGLGGVLGAGIGHVLCVGYDIVKGPWFPQAGVDPNPASWVGWWVGGGAVIGAAVGLVVIFTFHSLWRLVFHRGKPGP